jgi:formate dehydrogenase accessory protein FdhD
MTRPRRSPIASGPDTRDLSDTMKPGWNQHMSLQEASASVARLARFEPGVIAALPKESSLHIEVNGVLAGAVNCLPDAPAELALGWAFMHGFFGANDTIDSITEDEDRVSLMVQTVSDVDRRRIEAVGWVERSPAPDARDLVQRDPFAIHIDVLMDVVRTGIKAMTADRARDGYVHAAIASDTSIHCVARDQSAELAVSKVVGWMLRDGRELDSHILLVRGMVDRAIVSAASRLGVPVLATTGVLTAPAFREATGEGMSVVGMVGSSRPGLLVDGGHVIDDVADVASADDEES